MSLRTLVLLLSLLPLAGCAGRPEPQAEAAEPDAAPAGAGQRAGPGFFAAEGPTLRYRWNGGGSFPYQVKIAADKADEVVLHQGTVTVTARPERPQPAAAPAADRKPTATAFVVHADGYLLTCAHVVAEASKLEVALGGRTYPATVLATDEARDLALIRIQAKDLSALPLANSDTVEVGLEVRAVGYPLSSILGDSVKATRGTVSGIELKKGQKLFQVDASINPGNSGGPLVNEQAEVLGVASAKLSGNNVTNVGFVVPINEAKRLLQQHKVAFATRGAADRLEGTALVKRVAAAVGQVTVTPGHGGPRADAFSLTVNGLLTESTQPKPQAVQPGMPPRFPRFPRIGPPAHVGGLGFNSGVTVRTDAWGTILQSQGDYQLPFLLGNVAQFFVEPLSQDGLETWEANAGVTITEKEGSAFPFGPMHRPFGPPAGFPGAPRPPFGRDTTNSYQAQEQTIYTRAKGDGDLVEITKRYDLRTQEPAGQTPRLLVTGEGVVTFDAKAGMPKALAFQLTIQQTQGQTTHRLPVTVSYKLLEGDELAKLQEDAKRAAAAAAEAAKPKPPQPVDDAELTRLLDVLKGSNHFERKAAAERLAGAQVDSARQAEVARALEGLLTDADGWVKKGAAQALGTWGTKDNVPALIKGLDDKDVFFRGAVLEALGKLKDERAVAPVAKLFEDFHNRRAAQQSLTAMGAMAEPAVLKIVEEGQDLWLRCDAIKLLKDIGTAASLKVLEPLANGSDFHLSRNAREAVEAINARK